MTALEFRIADLLIRHSIDLLRVEAFYQARVNILLKQLDRELSATLAGDSITEFGRRRLEDLLEQTKSRIEEKYVEVADAVPLHPLVKLEAEFITSSLARAVGVRLVAALPNEETLRALADNSLVRGGPAADWWAKQGEDTAFRFSNAVRMGVTQGETNAQIVSRVMGRRGGEPGVTEVSKQQAASLVRTSIQNVASVARRETFRNNSDILDGIRQVSTLDGRTSTVCVAYSGAQWDLDLKPLAPNKLQYNGGVPRHWGCRSSEVPIVKPIAPGLPEFMTDERASIDGPVSTSLSFGDWLGSRSKAFQDDLLGVGRADLWRKGTITLQQLLDQSGRPLSLEELRKRYKL